VADIFVSYTSSDRDWAFWIGQQLEKFGHTPRIHEWDISGGGDIFSWMEQHHDDASHVLCVVSAAYLKAPYSALERRAAQWAAITNRPNFVLPVFIEECKAPTLFAVLKRCDLHGLGEGEASLKLGHFLKPAAKPTDPVPFPGTKKDGEALPRKLVDFPGKPDSAQPERTGPVFNIPIAVPRHFLGRDEVLEEIEQALRRDKGRVAITALHGLRGVGKTTLVAAFAIKHRRDYRATWWIRGETEATIRADLVGLGVRLGWVAPDEKEGPAIDAVKERLCEQGDGILLIFDNAADADSVEPYFPTAGDAQVLVTPNSRVWRDIASPLQIDTWPDETGADYLVSRIERGEERAASLALSKALGGLPLALEQAAAYCERLEVSFETYLSRYEAASVTILDDPRDAPRAYHNRLTAAKTFELAIEEAAKRHPAAEPLIVYAALLAPEPIPLYLFSEARKEFGEPFASSIKGNGLDEAVAALRGFALIDRESIPDERNLSIATDCIRLHRLVRQVATFRRRADDHEELRRELIHAISRIYPGQVHREPATWPRARRLDPLAMALVANNDDIPQRAEIRAAYLLNQLDSYRDGALAAYAEAQKLSERALAIRERIQGPNHLDTAISLNNLGYLLRVQADYAGAQLRYERSLAIREKMLGSDHPDIANCLNNLGIVLREQGDLAGALTHHERALAIREKVLGFDHPDTASTLSNLGVLLQAQSDRAGARSHFDRALKIREKTRGPDHPDTALCLSNLGVLSIEEGDLATAGPFLDRALAIREKALGPDHPDTADSLYNLGCLQEARDDFAGALRRFERALGISEKKLGLAHPTTRIYATETARSLEKLGRHQEAKALREKFGL
jgi:tetratricopeptide (TPR) repeat protein